MLERLRAVLDTPAQRYRTINGARSFGEYLQGSAVREDEELLTEPVLADLLERVLGFPPDGYFPQLGRSGLKPDFTPVDLVAHRFVLDAKSSTQDLGAHELQIRRYIDQRQLDWGILFNLRELRVYARGGRGHDPALSFQLLPLWHAARGEALPDEAEIARFAAFRQRFGYRELHLAGKVKHIQAARPWADREERGETVEIDLDFLVDRLRDLSRRLADDAAAQYEQLERSLAMSPGRERALLRELELLALDLAPGADLGELPRTIPEYRAATGLAGRVWRQYLLRVSQLALTRIVLYRSWEDVEFVESCLYDGGFVQVYERLGRSLQQVLREAFSRGRERYRWLYGADNNYDWYRPRDEALADVLYALVPVPLGKLDADVLGGLYESYVDEIDRDRLGQFYTPRAVVRFMLDRAGFSGPDGVFRIEGDERRPRRVLDFATGSGGFLVEAARRLIDEAGLRRDDGRDLFEGLAAIARGFHGCEISPFPYYLTEVNLLLQVSRLLGRMRLAGAEPPDFALGVVHADTLSARRGPHESIEGLDPDSRLDRAELAEDERFGLVPLDLEKREAFQRVREDGGFDLVVGNPPYVSESNNKVLFDRLRMLPGWKDVYRGKSDYLYYFLQLAVEKVAPEGRLCVITPASWTGAGEAGWLRAFVTDALRLDQVFLFGSYRLFAADRDGRRARRRAPTPLIESAIIVATKTRARSSDKVRVVVLEDEVEAAAALSGDPEAGALDRDRLLEELARRAAGRAGRSKGILVHDVRHGDLVPERPWPLKHRARDVAPTVTAYLQQAIDAADSPVERLGERWKVWMGIETAADAYTARIQKQLPADVKKRLAATGAETGAPIMELPAGYERREPWKSHPEVLARSPEPQAILWAAVDDGDYAGLVRIERNGEAPDAVVAELERWRDVLTRRAEIKRNPKRRWYETAWPRDARELAAPKVIALHRTDRGRFALDERGAWQPSKKLAGVTAREDGLSVAYLCGLLNSELLDLWYAVRGRTSRDVWRDYEPKPMAEIPYRHVEGIAEGRNSEAVRALEAALAGGDVDAAVVGAAELRDALDGSATHDREAAGGLEALVRAIAANRRALLPHRALVPELRRIVKDPWRTGPVELDERAAVAALPASEVVSVRLDTEVTASLSTDGPLGRAALERDGLVFTRSRRDTARISGPPERLALLERLVAGEARLVPSELESLRLPRDLAAFRSGLERTRDEVVELLAAGRALVEAAERLVCRLYGLSRDLEDAVVEHAVARAGAGLPGADG